MMIRAVLIGMLVVGTLVTACSSGPADSATPEGTVVSIPYKLPPATPVGFAEDGCLMSGSMTGRLFESTLEGTGLELRAMATTVSPNTPTVWFAAADIEGPGHEGPGPIAVWWTQQTIPGPLMTLESIGRANSVAKQFPDLLSAGFTHAGTLGDLPDGVEGMDIAEQCALFFLSEYPDALTYSELIKPGRWFEFSNPALKAMVVEVSPAEFGCGYIYFEPYGNESEYAASSWPEREGRVVMSPGSCGIHIRFDQELIDPPPVVIDSVPQQYRGLIEQ